MSQNLCLFIQLILVIYDVDNLSDHKLIILDLEFNLDRYAYGARSFTRKPACHKANDNDFKLYQQKFSENLHTIALPASILLCRNSLCVDVNHLAILNSYTCQVTEACLEAFHLLGLHMPGWGELVDIW